MCSLRARTALLVQVLRWGPELDVRRAEGGLSPRTQRQKHAEKATKRPKGTQEHQQQEQRQCRTNRTGTGGSATPARGSTHQGEVGAREQDAARSCRRAGRCPGQLNKMSALALEVSGLIARLTCMYDDARWA